MTDATKDTLRGSIRTVRRARTPDQRRAEELGIADQLVALVDQVGARVVACYLSYGSEPGTREFIARALRAGVRIIAPLSRADGRLEWAAVTDAFDVEPGPLGPPEPRGGDADDARSPTLSDADLIVVPAAAIGRFGMRLGWGRGYYDRALTALDDPPPVYAVILDSELLDAVPTEPHDRGVDGVVTPTRIVDDPTPLNLTTERRDQMPTYTYACTACGHRFDAVQSFTDPALTECPECGGRVRKHYGSVGVSFRGSGFYRTDSRPSSTTSSSESGSPSTSGGSSGEKSPARESSSSGASASPAPSGTSSATSD